MSWWDDFTDYWKSGGPLQMFGLGSAGSSDIVSNLAASAAYQQVGYKPGGQIAAEGVRQASAQVVGAKQNVIYGALTAPVREVRNVVQTPFQALAMRTVDIPNVYSMVRGDRSKVAWYEDGKEGISFAQSVYGGLAAVIPGEQEIDTIDWTNNEQVRNYFDHGPQKWITGTLDAASYLALDPLLLAGTAGQRARIKYFVSPIRKGADVDRNRDLIDRAVAGEKTIWSSTIDWIFANQNDPDKIVSRVNFYDNLNPGETSEILANAARRGDRQLVGDILKSNIGDDQATKRLLARRDIVSANVARLKILEDKVTKGNLYPVSDNLKDIITSAVSKAIDEERLLIRAVGRKDPITGEQIEYGIAGSMMGRTVSRFTAVESWRNQIAETRSRTMFNEQYLTLESLPVRIITWLNPSGPIKEAPSGMFNLGNAGAAESWREVIAQIRVAQRETGINYRKIFGDYLRIPTKEQRADYLKTLEKNITRDIIVEKIIRPRFPVKIRKDQQKLFNDQVAAAEKLVDRMFEQRAVLQARVYSDIKRNNYVIFDESLGDPVVVQQLKTALEKIAQAEGVTYETIIDRLSNRPVFGSQAANVYHFMDVGEYAKVISENKEVIRNFLDRIEGSMTAKSVTGKPLSTAGQREVIDREIDLILQNPKGALDVRERVASAGKEFVDSGIAVADLFYGSVWKPLTLISVKYTARNIGEAWVRTLPALHQYALESGNSTFRAYNDWLGNPLESISRTVNNAKIAATARLKAGQAAKLTPEARTAAITQDGFVKDATNTLHIGLRTLRDIAEDISTLKDPTGKLTQQINNWFLNGNGILSKIKNSEARRFVIMLVDGDVDEALRLINASKDVSTLSRGLADFKDDLIRVAESFDEPIASGFYNKYLSNSSFEMILNYQKSLIEAAQLIDNVIASKVNAAAAWQEFDKLTTGLTPILKQKNDGTFEVMPGVPIPDWGAGQLGTFARMDASADLTYANVIMSGNRLIGQSMLARIGTNARVNPTSANWKQAYVKFVNEDMRSDSLLYKILDAGNNPQGATDKALLEMLKSRDFKGYRIVTGLQGASDDRILDHINAQRLMVEYFVPEIPGMAPGWLKNKVIKGELTEEEAITIPQDLRAAVSGRELTNKKAQRLIYYYNKTISEIFKYIGSLPETVLSRHPFYRSTYRMEARRQAKVLMDQGVDITSADSINRIQRISHKAAFKQLNQTLYTIERRTDFAQAMRFVQPFYMAQQNSGRFWLGAAAKNPALPFLYLHAWNTPNQVFDVRDSQGNSVESSLPFFSDEMIYISLPEGVAKFLGQDQLYFYKTSFDLVSNGALPIIPQGSGQIVSVPATALLRETNVLKIATDLGFEGDVVEQFVLPYLDPYASLTTQILPMPAWVRSLVNSGGNTPQAAARTDLIFQQMMMEADLNGVKLSDKQRAKMYKEAAQRAQNTYKWEAFFAGGVAFPAAAKFTVDQDFLKKEWRRYITRYGNVNGAVRFEQDYGSVKSVYARSSLSDNPGGLLATPQTLNNLRANMGLADALAFSDKYGDQGFGILGLLFNDGDPQDYSALVNTEFYNMKIGGRPVKQQNENAADAQRQREISIGWAEYMPFKNMIMAVAQQKGVRVNTNDWDTYFKPILDGEVQRISQKYPAWANARRDFDGSKGASYFYALKKAVRNKKYMQSVGKNNQIALAMREWYPFRDALASVLKQRGSGITAIENQDIVNALAQESARLSAKYPEFSLVYERFLASDSLEIRSWK